MSSDVVIHIFGDIDSEGVLSSLARLGSKEGGLDWDSQSAVEDVADYIVEMAQSGQAVTLVANDVGRIDDMFPQLRSFAQTADLSYTIEFGPAGLEGYDQGISWRPGLSEEQFFDIGNDGAASILLTELKDALAGGIEAISDLVESTAEKTEIGHISVTQSAIDAFRNAAPPIDDRRLFTRTTEEFDPESPKGTLVCANDLWSTYGFSEHGYDAAEMSYEETPVVWEVFAETQRFVDRETLLRLCDDAGLKIFETYDDYEEAKAEGYEGAGPGHEGFLCLEEIDFNQLLEMPVIQGIAEKAGYDAGRDYITVSNTQPFVTVFWRPGTYRVEGPLPVTTLDSENPHDIGFAPQGPRP